MELDLDVMNADEVLKDLFERGGFGAYKYVRVGGNYRFISVGSNHLRCVLDSEDGETAAFVKICERDGKRFGRPFGLSMSLKLSWDAVDQIRLPEVLEFELDWNIDA